MFQCSNLSEESPRGGGEKAEEPDTGDHLECHIQPDR